MVDSGLPPLFCCPRAACRGMLRATGTGLACGSCAAEYPVVEGIPVLLDPETTADPFTASEQRQWDAQAATYESRRVRDRVYMAGVQCVVALLDAPPNATVLDAACGTGLTLRQYRRPGLRVVALDLSLRSLLYLKERLPAEVAVDLVCGSLTALPLADRCFDRVVCANALQHLPDEASRSATVRELARVALPGARVVISAHNYSEPKRRRGDPREGTAGGHSGGVQWIHRFTVEEFEALLTGSLRVDRIVGAGLPLPYRFKLSPLMDRIERTSWRGRTGTRWSNMLVAAATREAGL